MASDLATLYEVQKLDTRIYELEREREALDSGVELRAQVDTLRLQAQAARDELRAMENEARDVELQIKAREAKRRDFEEKMYSGRVRNPKELDDMQREVEMLGAQVDKLEDQGLGLMEESEKRRTALSEQEAVLNQEQARFAGTEEHYQAETARIAAEIARLEGQKAALVPAIPKDLLRRYDELRARRGNLAVVEVSDGICSGCRIAISVDTVRQLKRGALVSCESCGRMLYWVEEAPAQ